MTHKTAASGYSQEEDECEKRPLSVEGFHSEYRTILSQQAALLEKNVDSLC